MVKPAQRPLVDPKVVPTVVPKHLLDTSAGNKDAGWAEEQAYFLFPYSAEELKVRFLQVDPPQERFPFRNGYDDKLVGSSKAIRAHHERDILSKGYALPSGSLEEGQLKDPIHAGVLYRASEKAKELAKAGNQVFALMRIESLIPPSVTEAAAIAYRIMFAVSLCPTLPLLPLLMLPLLTPQAGVRAHKLEDARGSNPALHVGYWLVYHSASQPPQITVEGDPARMTPEQAKVFLEFSDQVALMGHLSLLALDIIDPGSAIRCRR